MHEVLAEQPEDIDPQRVRRLDEIEGHLIFDDVSFAYEPVRPVLKEISWRQLREPSPRSSVRPGRARVR